MKKLWLLLFVSSMLYGQDTLFYNKGFVDVKTFKEAEYFKIIIDNPLDSKQNIEQIYFKKGKLKQELIVTKGKRQIMSSKSWHPEGQLHIEAAFKEGKKDGYFRSYYKTGQLKRNDEYKKGKLIKGVCYDDNGVEVPYYEFEVRPTFPGGEEALAIFLRKNIQFRNPSNNTVDNYRVIVQFDIAIDGSISNLEIQKGVNQHIDNLVLNAVSKIPKWNPGIQDGELVKVKYSLPVSL
jgi:protein TonB